MKKKILDLLKIIWSWLKWIAVPFIFILGIIMAFRKGSDIIGPQLDEEERKGKDIEKKIKKIEDTLDKDYTKSQNKLEKKIKETEKKIVDNAKKGKGISKQNKKKDKKIKKAKNFEEAVDDFDNAF